MKVFKFISLGVALFWVCLPLSAGYPSVINYTKSDYRAGTQNWDITTGPGNMVIFANNSGMLEFDGNNWDLTPVHNHTNVRSLYYDRENARMWAGAFCEFGYFSLDSRGRTVYTSVLDRFGNTIGEMAEIWKIAPTEDGMYLQGDNDVWLYSADTVLSYNIGSKINALAAIGNKVWLSSVGKGVMNLSPEGLTVADECNALKHTKICSFLPYQGNGVMMITEFDGVYVLRDRTVGRLTLGIESELRRAQVFCAATDGDMLALGTVSDGVYIVDLKTLEHTHLNIYSGLQNNSVLSAYFDREGNLWLGLDKGIDQVVLNSPETTVFKPGMIYGTGYASTVYDGRLYLGTNQGLFWMPYNGNIRENGEITQVPGINGQVWCLYEFGGTEIGGTKVGSTLFCGHDHGLYIVGRNGAERIDGLSGIWKIEECPFSPGDLLGCSYDGLFILRRTDSTSGGRWVPYRIKGFNEVSGSFEAQDDGTIWMYHWIKGLFRIQVDASRDTVTRVDFFGSEKGFPSDRNNITNSYEGGIVFSSDRGYWTCGTDGRVTEFGPLNKLFSTPPSGARIEESPYGDILFLSGTMQAIAIRENGSYAVDSLSLRSLQDKRIPGFDNVFWPDRDHFIINTEDGFSLIDVRKLAQKKAAGSNSVFVKNIYVTSRGDSLVFGARSARDQNLVARAVAGPVGGGKLRLPYQDNSLRFEFVLPQFYGRDAVKYSYKLEKYDGEWSEWSSVSSKEYTGLPEGSYEFKVRAVDVLTSTVTESAVAFSIAPPWYRSIAAMIFYAVLIALIFYLFVRYMNHRAERQTHEMEKEIVLLRNQTLEADLKHKSQDLATSAMNLVRKNEILIKIKNDIGKVQADIGENDDKSKTLKRLHRIQSEIRENIGHDDDWLRFEENFDEVYEDYLKRLKKEFPKLTSGELRLCAFLKMGLSSKDIASMMNVSARSVEMARYRLRLKLGLSRDTNLTAFLQNF